MPSPPFHGQMSEAQQKGVDILGVTLLTDSLIYIESQGSCKLINRMMLPFPQERFSTF